jgi:hypothetical protein
LDAVQARTDKLKGKKWYNYPKYCK